MFIRAFAVLLFLNPLHVFAQLNPKTATTEDGERVLVYRNGTWEPELDEAVPVVDIDGIEYKTVQIGRRVWMAENLRSTKLNDGTPIMNRTELQDWLSNVGSPSYAFYANDAALGTRYGALYNWAAVATGKLCPTGWRVPTRADFAAIRDGLSRAHRASIRANPVGPLETGRHLMATGDWIPDESAGDPLGFSALAAGGRAMGNGQNFRGQGSARSNSAHFYTSEIAGDDPYSVSIYSGFQVKGALSIRNYVGENPKDSRVFGHSVRCVRIEKARKPFPPDGD
jgi:uncharacterized protein (TIGR02145 family)